MKNAMISETTKADPRWASCLFGLLRRGAREEHGQSFVELALALPVLTAILLGAVEFGRLAYGAIEVQNAAEAGALYGSQTLITAADSIGMKKAAVNDASDITAWSSTPLSVSNTTANQVCKCDNAGTITQYSCAVIAIPTNCPSTAHILNYVQVNTQATVDPLFYVAGLPKSYSLKGYSLMRVSQQ